MLCVVSLGFFVMPPSNNRGQAFLDHQTFYVDRLELESSAVMQKVRRGYLRVELAAAQ